MRRFRAFTFSLVLVSATLCASNVQAFASGAGSSAKLDSKPGALLRKSYSQMVEGDYREAVDTQVMAEKADRDSVTARRYLSYSLLKLGASDEAMGQLKHLLSMTRATPIDMCMCGEALLQAGRLNHAEKWFKEALSADPSMNCARVGLSNVSAKRKMIASAKATANVVPPADEKLEKELVAAEAKTTFELGQVQGDGTEIASSATTTVSQGTSLASETARQLRLSSASQQVAVAVPSATKLVASQSGGNNQVVNAWSGFKGVQKR
jgi:tetratricopeptide (TPR) repeat protein